LLGLALNRDLDRTLKIKQKAVPWQNIDPMHFNQFINGLKMIDIEARPFPSIEAIQEGVGQLQIFAAPAELMPAAGTTFRGGLKMYLKLDLVAACRDSRDGGLAEECRRLYQLGIGEFQHTSVGGSFPDNPRAQEVWRQAVGASLWGPPVDDLHHGGVF
jgi:hypothetical protein